MPFCSLRPVLLLILGVSLVSCGPPPEPEAQCATLAKLATLVDRQLGSPEAPVRVVALLPVNNGCQDVIGEYLADVAQRFPAVFQVRILAMKSPAAKELMESSQIHCAAVIVNGKTTFDLGGEEGRFILEGPMDPRDVARALDAAAREAVKDRAPQLPPAPEQPGIENMPKRTF